MTTQTTSTSQAFDDTWEQLVRDLQPDAPFAQMNQFIYTARHTRLDPLTRQIYMIRRGNKWGIQASIDGFRAVAARTGRYEGQVGPHWCGPDGVWRDVWLDKAPPAAARIGVLSQGMREPTWGVARFDAYSAGGPMWSKMPDVMLAKCAEALALRKVFPSELSGVYTSDEMDQAGPTQPKPLIQTQVVGSVALEDLDAELTDLSPLEAEQWLDRLRVSYMSDEAGATELYNRAVRMGKVT